MFTRRPLIDAAGRRRARVLFGRLLLSTTFQAANAPRIDAGHATDLEGRRYRIVTLGTGPRTRVLGWRGPGPVPNLHLLHRRTPRPLRPAVHFLFAARPFRQEHRRA